MGNKTGCANAALSSEPKEPHSMSVSSYFQCKIEETESGVTGKEAPKMVDESIEIDQEQGSVTINDLESMEDAIIGKIAALLQPI